MDKDLFYKSIKITSQNIANNPNDFSAEEIEKYFLEFAKLYNTITPKLPIVNSRCCGRCDGINDLCVADTLCEEHDIVGCEKCFPYEPSEQIMVGDKVIYEGREGIVICYYKDQVSSDAVGIDFKASFKDTHNLNGRLDGNTGKWVPINFISKL